MLDIGYFARSLLIYSQSKRKKIATNLLDNFLIKGRCWASDLDFNWHMNNSRYIRHCDFGRFAFLLESGLWNVLLKRRTNGINDCAFVVSAFQAQYRQSLKLGDQFQVLTRIHSWDEKAFYLEQSMILERNQQIAFLLFNRLALTPRDLTPQMFIDDLHLGSIQSPTFSTSMLHFKENYQLKQ